MVDIVTLWLPITFSGLAAVVTSLALLALLPWHRMDYRPFPDEDAVRNALAPQRLTPGQYNIPNLPNRAALKDPAYVAKLERGPVGFLTLMPNRIPSTAKGLALSLTYYLAASTAVAYVASQTIPPGAEFMRVFRVIGAVAWLAYATAVVPDAIWWGRPWKAVWKQFLDAFVIASVTAAVFAWRWPG